ncbi:hypothetical protein B0H14DRAFT_2571328 [Mycena olivaceomarginata]|nr:hypothetical protein B0H14DRAFT_2571328 [Mycena olivaceomarginata]
MHPKNRSYELEAKASHRGAGTAEEVEVCGPQTEGGEEGCHWEASPRTGTEPMLPSSVEAVEEEVNGRVDHAGNAEDWNGGMIIAEYRIEDDHSGRWQQRL